MEKIVRGTLASLAVVLACGARSEAQSPDQGRQIFTEKAEPPCALCHTLQAAGSSGEIGPNLDTMRPNLEKIRRAVKFGVGAMPPYAETLSDAEIETVAAYVADAAGRGK